MSDKKKLSVPEIVTTHATLPQRLGTACPSLHYELKKKGKNVLNK